jgi:two-component system chemotaxis sensor kinase CheA
MDAREGQTPHFLADFRDLAHLCESLLQRLRDNPGEAIGAIPLLFEGVDLLKVMLVDFRRDNRESPGGSGLLGRLKVRLAGQQPGASSPKPAQNKPGVILDMVQQTLLMIETGLDQMEGGGSAAASLGLCRRGCQSLLLAARKVDHPQLASLMNACCEPFAPGIIFSETEHLPAMRARIEAIRQTIAGNRSAIPAASETPAVAASATVSGSDGQDRSVRMSQGDIDDLMNLIGELKVHRNSLQGIWDELEQSPETEAIAERLKPAVDAISILSEELHRRVMSIRLLPLGLIFSRFPRLVRDLAKKLGKEIRLEMQGESTVIDKNIIDSLSDPLIHMIRNAADHGLESPEDRTRLGKAPTGSIMIKATNEGQRVVIEVSDDGCGLDSEKIRIKALRSGQYSPERLEAMGERELHQLLFAPGFSLSETVSEISGRGVGLDVVLTNIERVGGEIEIFSKPGQGTRFLLHLPLTLAIGRGLLVESGGQRFYLPIDAVMATLPLKAEELYEFKGREAIVVRGEVMRTYRLDRLLNLQPEKTTLDGEGKTQKDLVIVEIRKQHLAVIVDACHREAEYVVRPLQGLNHGADGFSGAMITAEGGVVLVLDLPALIARFEQKAN